MPLSSTNKTKASSDLLSRNGDLGFANCGVYRGAIRWRGEPIRPSCGLTFIVSVLVDLGATGTP